MRAVLVKIASAAASASSAAVDAIDAADQLMGFAEASYPQFFPSHRTTRQAGERLYRYYPESGIYLGVRQGQVHVLGGAFGAEPLAVGALESFITPRTPAASGACAVGSPTHGLFVTPAPALGRNAALALLGCSTTIARARCQQTTGPAVGSVAARTQAISFGPPAVGDYGFRGGFTGALGGARSASVALRGEQSEWAWRRDCPRASVGCVGCAVDDDAAARARNPRQTLRLTDDALRGRHGHRHNCGAFRLSSFWWGTDDIRRVEFGPEFSYT